MSDPLHALLAQAREGRFPPAAVLVGSETFLVERAVALLRKAAVGDGIKGFNDDLYQGQGARGAEIVATASTMPMMASHRFVLVRHVDAMSAAEQEPLAAYLERPAESTCLVLTAEKLDGRGKLLKAAKKSGALVEIRPLKGSALRQFAASEARARGHVLEADAGHALMDALGEDLATLDDSLERLSLYVGEGAPIDLPAVEACVTRVRVDTIWALVDAVSLRDGARAIGAASSLLADREPPLRILAMLARQLRMIARMREALAGGMRGAEAAKAAGAPPFKAAELTEAAKRFNLATLGRAFETLAATDRLLKGSRQPPDAVLQQAILRLCGL